MKAEIESADLSKLENVAVEIVICMDCTGSMSTWIEAAKATSMSTVQRLRSAVPNATFKLGFVGYRDFGDADAIITVPLTEDVAACEARLRSVHADGGGDTPEDMAGGLHAALNMPWTDAPGATRVVIVVADAPPHGADMHDVTTDDNWPRVDPAGRDSNALRELVRDLARRSIDLYFMKITSETDVCIREFARVYDGARVNDAQSFVVLKLAQQSAVAPSYGLSVSASALPPPMVHAVDGAIAGAMCAPVPPPSACEYELDEFGDVPSDAPAPRKREAEEAVKERSVRYDMAPRSMLAGSVMAPSPAAPSAPTAMAPMAPEAASAGTSDDYADAIFSCVMRSAVRRHA